MLMESFVLAHSEISHVVYRCLSFLIKIVVLMPSYNAYCCTWFTCIFLSCSLFASDSVTLVYILMLYLALCTKMLLLG